jgi:hypothetical protein
VFIRSFQKSQELDPGFDTAHLLTVELNLNGLRYSRPQTQELYRRIKSALSDLPGVESVSLADVLPLGNQRVLTLRGMGPVATATVDAGYFQTMGIRLLSGRRPESQERDVSRVDVSMVDVSMVDVSMVNQALMDELRSGQRRLDDPQLGQVAGVVANSKYWSLDESARPFVYRISATFDQPAVCLAIRSKGPAGNLAARVNRTIQRLNGELPPVAAQTGQQRLRMWLEPQRAAALLLGVLGFAALGLAIAGLYGLLAQLLVQRTSEIAVRVALGSSRGGVLWLLLRQSAVLLSLGMALGLAATLVVAKALAAALGAIGGLGAPTMLAVVTLLAAVGAGATAFPAYGALRIDPASALRRE